ncbi:MAG TPA: hypothetical protein VKB69_12450, partial [Micromonosporaceae bacterium]|nr:hypothetical protein [Micromonosporaceae bacterium]
MAIRRWRSAPHAVSVACLLVATSGACTSPAPAGPDARRGTITVPSTASPPESVPSNCTFTLAKGPLPEWAREGFSTP